VRPIRAGSTISSDDVASIRPAGGLSPDDLHLAVGAIARVDLAQGAAVTFDVIDAATDPERR
jgi:sialic acid synthase SpsE